MVGEMEDDATTTKNENSDSSCRRTKQTRSSSRILFGSCSSQHLEQPLWPAIISRNATAFVWGGDAVYADDRIRWKHEEQGSSISSSSSSSSSRRWTFIPTGRAIEPATPSYLRSLYNQQRLVPGYKALLDTGISIFGTIDDHDYGINNGDKLYKWKRESGMEYVNTFLGIPKTSAMFQRASKGFGVYGVQVYDFNRPYGNELLSDDEAGLDPDVIAKSVQSKIDTKYTPRGSSNSIHETNTTITSDNDEKDKRILPDNKLVAVFVLDVRTNKNPWLSPSNFYKRLLFRGKRRLENDGHDNSFDGEEGDFLGKRQWEWFETALSQSEAAVNVIVTGLQVHPNRFMNFGEDWSQFPHAQHRLYQTLLQHNVQSPIIVSGDIHVAQLLLKDCQKKIDEETLLSTPASSSSSTTTSSTTKKTTMTTSESSSLYPDKNYQQRRPLLEVTTSGMTHSWGSNHVCGRIHLSPHCRIPYINYLTRFVADFAHWINPWTELLVGTTSENVRSKNSDEEGKSSAKGKKKYTSELNFAELDFDWDNKAVTVRIWGKELDENDDTMTTPLLSSHWGFDELSGKIPLMTETMSYVTNMDFIKTQQWLQSRSISLDENHGDNWICTNYRGHPNPIHSAFGSIATLFVILAIISLPFVFLVIGILIAYRRCQRYKN